MSKSIKFVFNMFIQVALELYFLMVYLHIVHNQYVLIFFFKKLY